MTSGYNTNRPLIIGMLFSVFVFACTANKQPDKNIDYIIYGIYCGECEGHCATMYKLDSSSLLVDTADTFYKYSEGLVVFKSDTLSRAQFLEAQVLKTKIPKLLLNSNSKRFGHPDERDQCGIYLQIKMRGKWIKSYHIDTSLRDIPAELRDYAQLIMHLCRFRPL
jgi:hypothetical protein